MGIFQFIKRMIKINGISVIGGANNSSIIVSNGRILVGGKDVTPDSKDIKIEITGDVETLRVDACNTINIKGNVGKVNNGAGDIVCGDVTGDVESGAGDIECGTINGNVETGAGDVRANVIKGSVNTGAGDIKFNSK